MINNSKKKNFKIKELKKIINKLDANHTHQRKIQFLLDIRGYIKVNNLKGTYVEFGSYLSEMQIAAYMILHKLNSIKLFFGIDIFKQKSNFIANYKKVESKIKKISKNLKIYKLDLEKNNELNKKKKMFGSILVSVIDCNEKKALKNSLDFAIKNTVNGGIIYIDDYFIIKNKKLILKKELAINLKKYKKQIETFKTYPPFGLAFIILNK